MKRKIAILLSAVMVAGAMPMSAMASSTNSISKTATATVNNPIAAGNLIIRPTGTFELNDYFYLTFENATINQEYVDNSKFDFNTNLGQEYTGEKTMSAYSAVVNSASVKTPRIPYELTLEDEHTLKVSLFAFTEDEINSDAMKTSFGGITPYVSIPLNGIVAENSGEVKVKIDNNGTSITDGTYTVATVYGSGSTTTTVASIKTFDGAGTLDKITVKENVSQTFVPGQTVTLRLNSGFNFTNAANVKLSNLRNAKKDGVSVDSVANSELNATVSSNVLTFTIPETITFDQDKIGSFAIEGLNVEPADEDKNYGTVKLTISGSKSNADGNVGITQETIEVAKRESASFSMEVVGEPTTIVAGRTDLADSNLDSDKFKTARIKFSENVAEAWGAQRLDFTVPEGVQIVEAKFNKVSGGNELVTGTTVSNTTATAVGSSNIQIVNKGRTLRFAKGFNSVIENSKATDFEMTFKLSIEAGYEGDVKVSVTGGGISEGDVKDVVVAKAIQPIKIETNTTRVNIGYQDYSTADIVITETEPGMLLSGRKVELALTSLFNTNDIAITNADVEVEGDELTITGLNKTGSNITFSIDNSSYEKAATIRVKNVKVGTTRAIPYGSYGLAVSGDAIINNYNKDKNAEASSSENVDFAYNDNISKYEFADYINILSTDSTLNNTVKVTIGEKTMLIDEKAADMDVAPYIQASSNSTMVPLRFVTVALGLDNDGITNADETSKITFDANSKTATIYYGVGSNQKLIQFQAGSNRMLIDGTVIPMANGVLAEIKDGRMFVPFRALGQALGVNVSWDEETRTAIYNA